MKKIIPLKATGEQNNSFVGIKVSDNEIEFHYPEAYSLDDSDGYKKDILNILRTIRLANSRTKETSELFSRFNENDSYPLYSYLFILNDYFENKRYVNKEKIIKRGIQGKILWNKTLRKAPLISDGNIVLPIYISELKQQQDNILTEIYKYCVWVSAQEIGWYYGLSDNVFKPSDFTFNRSKYISVLKQAIGKTFDDVKRKRLMHMKNIITGLDDKSIRNKKLIRGVDSYEYVFEAMIDTAFGNTETKNSFFPHAEWHLLEAGRMVLALP